MTRVPEQAKSAVIKAALLSYKAQLDREYFALLKALQNVTEEDELMLMINLQGNIETRSIILNLLEVYNVV